MTNARESTGAWKLARAIVWAQRRNLTIGLVVLLVDRAAGFVLPLAPKVLLDEVVGRHRTDLLGWLAGAVLAATAVQAAARFALQRIVGLSAELVVLRWRRRVMAHVLRMPLADTTAMPSGALVSRIMDDAAALQNLVGTQLARWVSNIVTAVVALVALLWIDWRMTLVALGFVAVPGLALDVAHRKLRPLFRQRAELRAEIAGRLAQTVAGVRVVKVYRAEHREETAFTQKLHRLFRLGARATMRHGAMSAIAVMVSAGVVAIVVVMGGAAMVAGTMSVGAFGSYVAFALTFAAPLLDLPEIATRVAETLADLERLRALEAVPCEGASVGAKRSLHRAVGELAFENVTFEYRPGTPVLRDVTFRARPGTTTAIVGASGAGKSTVLSLLMAFYRPTRGRILVDGVDIAEIGLGDWRRQLAVVLQDDFLFDGTMAENIALARAKATRTEIARAATLAHLDDVIGALPAGLDTRIGERGIELSGGQRQRVAIARALLADAPIVLFDEATSSLDGESEGAVLEAMRALADQRTVLVIAHRLSTIRAADQIVVLDRGVVVESGTHDTLLERGGRYRALYEAQAGGPRESRSVAAAGEGPATRGRAPP